MFKCLVYSHLKHSKYLGDSTIYEYFKIKILAEKIKIFSQYFGNMVG
jgi:hypothetical protein